MSEDIVGQPTISYIYTYDIVDDTYDIVYKTYNIVGQPTIY